MESREKRLNDYWEAQAQFGPFDVGPDEYLRGETRTIPYPRCSRCGGALGTSGPLCDKCVAEKSAQYDIGSAVLAERERCAKIADAAAKSYSDWDNICHVIAREIREGK